MNHLTPGSSGDGTRTPPHNYDAERALLAAIILNNKSLEKVVGFLRAEHFADPANGALFGAMAALIDRGLPADPATLKSSATSSEAILAAGGTAYVAGICGSVVTMINAGEYGRIIHDAYLRRELIGICSDIIGDSYAPGPDRSGGDIVEDMESRLHGLVADDGEDWGADIGTLFDQAMLRWQAHDRGERTGLMSDLLDLDKAAGPLEPGDFLVNGGRPGMAKTTFERKRAMNIARHFRRVSEQTKTKPKWVLFFSAEMTKEQLADGVIATGSGVQQPRQRQQRALNTNEWAKVLEQGEDLRTLPLRIIAKPAPTLSFIRSVARRMLRRGGVGLIVVDYLQIMGLETGARNTNRVQEVSYLARGLKETAKQFHCPVIALSQLSRAVETRDDKRPNMSDLRESGEIEAAADQILLLFRPAYYLEREKPQKKTGEKEGVFLAKLNEWEEASREAEGVLEVGIGKSRFGESGKTVLLHIDLARGDISNAARDHHEGAR